MTSAAQPGANPFGLMRAAEAATNWRALTTAVLAGLAIFLCFALSAWLVRGVVIGLLFSIVTLIVSLIGYSSVGIVLMRRAQGQDVSISDAVMQAVLTVHRLLGVAALLFLIVLGVALASMVVLLVCKLPGVGNLLFAIVFPIIAVVLGVTIAGTFYVAFPLAAPCIWAGNTIWQTTARVLVMVRQRLLSVVTNLVVLSMLVFFLFGVVWFILYAGMSVAVSLSNQVGIDISLVRGVGSLMGGVLSGLAGAGSDGDGAMSYLQAFAFAIGLLFMLLMIIPYLTFINGICLIYLQTVDGLQFDDAEAQLRGHMDEAKRRAQEAKERASAKLQEATAGAQPSSLPPAPPPAPAPSPPVAAPIPAPIPAPAAAPLASARSCSNCHEPLAPDDVFCGGCGTKNPL